MAIIKCPHCGNYISSNVKYCTECGKEIMLNNTKDISEGNNLDEIDQKEKNSTPLDIIEGFENDEVEDSKTTIKNDTSLMPNPMGESVKKWYQLSARRIVVLCVLVPFVLAAVALVVADIRRANALEQRAFDRLENCTDLLVFEDFILRFPDNEHIEEVKERYETLKVEHEVYFRQAANGDREKLIAFMNEHPTSPYLKVCENRLDSLDWNVAVEQNSLESYRAYIAQHAQGIFLSDATDALNRQMKLVVTPEENSVLRGAVENFLSAMTAQDAERIDGMTGGMISFCGVAESTGQNVVDYYKQNMLKEDVLGVHFQLGGISINKRNVGSSDALSYNLYSTAVATINRSSLDSAMVVNYKVSASFTPERRITSVSLSPIVEVTE